MKRLLIFLFAVGMLSAQTRDSYFRFLDVVNFATLTAAGSQPNGTMVYCSDCSATTPTTGSGTGAFAFRINGTWASALGGGGGTGCVPSVTTDLLAGDGAGGCTDSFLLPSNVVTLNGTQTLTGKSISASQINSGFLATAQGGLGSNTAPANSIWGNFTGSLGVPGYSATPVFSAALLTGFPTFNQNTTGTAANATGINGAAVPASQPCLGSNGSSQLIAGTCGGGGSGTVTTFSAPAGSWPSWLVPTVATATTTPSLTVAATQQGNGTKVQMGAGTTTSGDCAEYDANGNIIDAGAPCIVAGMAGFITGGGTGTATGTIFTSCSPSVPCQVRQGNGNITSYTATDSFTAPGASAGTCYAWLAANAVATLGCDTLTPTLSGFASGGTVTSMPVSNGEFPLGIYTVVSGLVSTFSLQATPYTAMPVFNCTSGCSVTRTANSISISVP